MNKFLLHLLLWLSFVPLGAQEIDSSIDHLDSLYFFTPTILSEYDEVQLKNLPKFQLSPARRTISLPTSVNNAVLSCFPPIFYQAALECGQAASLTYLFSYETAIRRGYTDLNYSYSHHYTAFFNWNFCNGGQSTGVSLMDSWQTVRSIGAMFVPDWGASYNDGGPTKWVSGYEKYYNAMHNRIVEMIAIPTDTEEGILALKHWLYDHACGDQPGGMVNFYAQHKQADAELPAGTPEAGFSFMTTFSSTVNHTLTIVGYNDSIRYDFNGDGIYTNNIDINDDGIIDVKDWEIGGVLFCNSFGSNYGTDGFCYMPYKLLASYPSEGGIWNKSVYAVKIRDEVFPQLTAKVKVRHNVRNMLQITAGVAPGANASAPEYQLDLYAFNYQGGEWPMQGEGSQTSSDILELGLDLSPLLNFVAPNQEATYFLIVNENDENGNGMGEVLEFSLMDYTTGNVVPTPCATVPADIVNNGTILLKINKIMNFSKPEILTDSLSVNALEDFNRHLYAEEGKPGYRWELSSEYTITEVTDSVSIPVAQGAPVLLSDNASGYATIDLPFGFPCFGDIYNRIIINADGYLTFHYDTYNWPFLKSSKWQQRTTRMIAPFRANLVISEVLMHTDNNRVIISFVGKISGQSNNSLRFSVALYESGVIEFYYGNMTYTGTNFYAAISRGDGVYFEELPISAKPASIVANRVFRLTPPNSVPGIVLNANGILSGKVPYPVTHAPLDVICYDNNDVKCRKTIDFTAHYPNPLVITDAVAVRPEDGVFRSGDTISLALTVRNVDTIAFNGCQLQFSTPDPYVLMLDSVEYFGYIAGGNEYRLNNAISFVVDEQVPHNYPIVFDTQIINDENFIAEGEQRFVVSGYDVSVANYEIIGDNQHFDSNEWNICRFEIKNVGVLPMDSIRCLLRFEVPDISVVLQAPIIENLMINEVKSVDYQIFINSIYQQQSLVDAYLDFYDGNRFLFTKVVTLYVDWNCFDFSDSIPNVFQPTDWLFDEDEFALVSNNISHSDSTGISYSGNFDLPGTITFSYKISSENNYDWLSFYVDSIRVLRWSGVHNWATLNYDFLAGFHTFEWRYEKDYSVHGGEDKAWLKYICFRQKSLETPILTSIQNEIHEILPRDTITTSLVELQSVNELSILFNAEILDENLNFVNWAFLNISNGSINPSETKNLEITLSSVGKHNNDVCNANLHLKAVDGNEVLVPITMEVVSPVAIDTENETPIFRCFPNPTEGQLTIELSQPSAQMLHCVLYDLYGRKLMTQPLSQSSAQLNLQTLPSGVYLLEVEGFKSVKIVKE